ncbi:MAG: cyclic nucleotide-binding domain-containing protein [Acidimicrobiales bacterium]|nr:cyclic nucleotide-binding domain-containing protein [Acidimicrobiales bacterium]
MSDVSQGPGWWLASDSKWYPPELHPSRLSAPSTRPAIHKVTGVFRNADHTMKVPAGGIVFQEGEVGEEMFGVIEGQIQLQTTDRVIAILGPDEVFGEMALIDSSPRMATAVALSDSVLAVLNRHRFLFLVHETPTFSISVMATMADRLREHWHPAPGGHDQP